METDQERGDAIILSNKILDNANLDPDGDLSMMSRQFLRALEEVEYWKDVLRDCIEIAEVGFGKPTTISRTEAQKYVERIKTAKERLNEKAS